MYELSVSLEKNRSKNFNYDYYRKYFDKNIKKLYIRNDNYQKITLGVACIDYGYSMARSRFRSF